MVESLNLSQERDKNQKLNKPVINLDYAGLLAKVVRKLAKKGKHAKGEESLLKALKKVDLAIKSSSQGSKESKSANTSPLVSKGISKGVDDLVELKLKKRLSGQKNDGVKIEGGEKSSVDLTEKPRKALSLTTQKGVKAKKPETARIQKSPLLKALNDKPKYEDSLLGLLAQIIQKAKPLVRLKKVRVAGITHQKPVPLTRKQAETEAIKRILVNAKTRSEKSASVRLAKEFEEIYTLNLSNKTLTEIRDLHKAADANKANLSLK